MRTTDYPSDLTDAQFARLAPLLPRARPGGRPRSVNLHDVVNGILYVNRTGCQWRQLPKDYPPWSTCYDYFRKWRQAGVWQQVNDALRARVRRKAGRKRTPKTAALDSQSAKAGGSGGEVGYDAGKKVSGRKRHLLVDSLGLLLAVLVTAASVTDAKAAADLLAALPLDQLPRLRVIWADAAYATAALAEEVAFWGRYELVVVRRPGGARGWVLVPKRWVVERTFAWLLRFRRHARDYERRTDTSEAMIYVSMVHVMLHRLEPEANRRPFKYRRAA
jgi:putative transposase